MYESNVILIIFMEKKLFLDKGTKGNAKYSARTSAIVKCPVELKMETQTGICFSN